MRAPRCPCRRRSCRCAGVRTWRKRWRYVGAYDEAVMLCAAVARVGPAGETFWALWDRREGRMRERTRRLLPWGRRDVVLEGDLVRVRAGEVEIELWLGEVEPVESHLPQRGGRLHLDAQARRLPGRGFGARSPASTIVSMAAASTTSPPATTPGHLVVLVRRDWHGGRWPTACLEPGQRHQRPAAQQRARDLARRAGERTRARRVRGARGDPLRDGSRLRFAAEGTRAHREVVPFLFRSDYEAPFGTFSGSLGGVELEAGLGVMERHDAVW